MSQKTAASPGLLGIKRIDELDIAEKRVFLRVDFNVPLEDGRIVDDMRIRAALPTISYALEKGAKLAVASHLGRPEKEDRPPNSYKYSMEPVARRLTELLGLEVILVDDPSFGRSEGIVAWA